MTASEPTIHLWPTAGQGGKKAPGAENSWKFRPWELCSPSGTLPPGQLLKTTYSKPVPPPSFSSHFWIYLESALPSPGRLTVNNTACFMFWVHVVSSVLTSDPNFVWGGVGVCPTSPVRLQYKWHQISSNMCRNWKCIRSCRVCDMVWGHYGKTFDCFLWSHTCNSLPTQYFLSWIFSQEKWKRHHKRLMQDCSQQSYSNRPEWQTTQMHHECTTTCVFMELNTIKGGAQLLGGISKVLCREWKVRRKIMVQLHLFADKEQAMQTSKVIPSVRWEAGSWGCFVRGPWEFLARWKSSVSCFLWELPRIYKLQNSFTWTFWCI